MAAGRTIRDTAADLPREATAPIAANALTLTGTASFVPAGAGGGAFYTDFPEDGAMQVLGAGGAGSASSASATGLVEDTDNWTVMGWLQPQAATGPRVAISQDGQSDSTFAIGTKPELTPAGDGTELRFAVTVDNASGGADTTLINDQLVTPGDWYHVTAVYEVNSRTLTLTVTDRDRRSQEASVDLGYALPTIRGRLRVGSGTTGGVARPWHGLVDEVAHFRGSMSTDQILTYAFLGR